MGSYISPLERLAAFRWRLRVRHTGTLEWICPSCGFFNRSRLNRTTWVVKCGEELCHLAFGVGAILYVLPGGRRDTPRDICIPTDRPRGMVDAFPHGEVSVFENGQPINRIMLAREGQFDDSDEPERAKDRFRNEHGVYVKPEAPEAPADQAEEAPTSIDG